MKFLRAIALMIPAALGTHCLFAQGEVLNPSFPYWKTKGNIGIATPAVPATYGTSTIGVAENWMGTTDANDVVWGTNTIERMRLKQTTGLLGIGTATPASLLDINGDLALREGTPIALSNGVNAVTLTGEFSHYRLTGPTAAYSINTIANGNNGQMLTLINGTNQIMTINNNNAANGILTGTGANLVSVAGVNNSVTLIYNASLARWVVTAHTGMVSGNDWHLTGNTAINDPAAPATYGVSTIAANENWMGTTDGNDVVWGTNNLERMRLKQTTGMVGIGNATPASLLDINGDLALREGTAIALANGVNAITLTGEFSHYRLTGPTAAFSVNTIANGNNGQILTLINGTSQVMTINNNNAANGILTGTGANLVSVTGTNNSVTLIYNATLARWVVTAYTGMVSGNDWHLTGNTAINDPAAPATYGTSLIAANENWMGTTDANDIVWGTDNIERMRLKQTTGNVGIGLAAPPNRLTVQPSAVATPSNATTYAVAINSNTGLTDLTLGSTASYVYQQSWNSKPFLINSQGNFVGINLTTNPIQALDINGRMNVNNGVIQRGTTQINVTNDLGLYSQIAGNWIRIAANAAPVKFFTDQNGGNNAGNNALVAMDNTNGGGVMIAAETGGTGNAGAPYARAALEVSSTTKGMLTPRLTTNQRDAMGNNLAEGLLIYNTDNECFEWWDTKSTPAGGNGFWNSLCEWCDQVVIVSSSQTGFNLNTYVGGATARNYCVYVNAGVTLTPSGNGGGSGAAGNSGFNATTMPAGASVVLYNYGTIYGGGGNGGDGGQESDLVCSGDNCGQNGGAGGSGIATNSNVPVRAFNYGTIRAGGGGGGGGGYGCCAASGGGGGGAGTPAGTGGGGRQARCVRGFVCGCSTSAVSGGGAAGTALTGGAGGGGNTSLGGTGCPTCNAAGAQNGGNGGVNAVAGTTPGGTCAGNGGAAGLALQGNGSGSSLTNVSGTVTGAVNP